ncbi:peptidoglycan-binding protein [Streptomyces sp. NPDC001594]|uniref:peptidoglycan-binding protein n=1 Tax=Streptomyces sp. NPDC001594 TaxID=3364590 RepID=UPI0036CF34E8
MGEIWIPEAVRLGDGVIGGPMDTPDAPPRTVWHTTETGAGPAAFAAVAEGLIDDADEPHILYDPTTDALGQFGPLNQSARALRNAGALRTNRTGEACIQIEVLARAGTPFTGYWKPGPNFAALLRAIRSWGVPDVWPAGRLARSGSDDVSRSTATWTTRAGHYGHCQIPGNDHWDPGAIDTAALLAAGGGTTSPAPAPAYEPFPGAGWFVTGRRSPIIAAMHARLVAVGCNRYQTNTNLDVWGSGDKASYAAWQRKLGYSGADADGIPGPTSWARLQVPNV